MTLAVEDAAEAAWLMNGLLYVAKILGTLFNNFQYNLWN
jgi:hypothetical protein